MKVKLRSFDSVIYTEEHNQEVRYLYTIEDSSGLLEVVLTIPEEAEPVEQFVLHIKDIYKGYKEYNIFHGRFKYLFKNDKDYIFINKIKMY